MIAPTPRADSAPPAPPSQGHDDKAERRRLASTWTLTQLYVNHVWPLSLQPRGRKKNTRREHLVSLRHWEAICGHPPLNCITQRMCSYFVDQLQRLPGATPGQILARPTVIKHCVALQMILDHAGPDNRRRGIVGAKLLKRKRIPYLHRPRPLRRPPRKVLTLDQLGRLFAATEKASKPQLPGVRPWVWWLALFAFTYNTALRRMTVLAAEWEWLAPNHWLYVPPGALKQGGDTFWINPAAREAIEPLHAIGNRRIFPWPMSESSFHIQLRALMDAAGIEATDSRWRGLHWLRDTTLTWLASENPMVAQIVGGHRGGVTKEHYVDKAIVIPYLERLPQPAIEVASIGGNGR